MVKNPNNLRLILSLPSSNLLLCMPLLKYHEMFQLNLTDPPPFPCPTPPRLYRVFSLLFLLLVFLGAVVAGNGNEVAGVSTAH